MAVGAFAGVVVALWPLPPVWFALLLLPATLISLVIARVLMVAAVCGLFLLKGLLK